MNRQLFYETWRTVLDSIRSHKLRAGLTLTGVIIGTAVVASGRCCFDRISQRVAEVSEKSSPNVIYFTKQDRIGPSLQEPTAEERQRKDLTYEDILAVAALDSPQAVSPQKFAVHTVLRRISPKVTANSRTAINPLSFRCLGKCSVKSLISR